MRGLPNALAIVVLGTVAITGNMRVDNLAQHFPRAQDLFYEQFALEALASEDMTIPEGRVFVLTYAMGFSSDNNVFFTIKKNGESLGLIAKFDRLWDRPDVLSLRQHHPISFAFLPNGGDWGLLGVSRSTTGHQAEDTETCSIPRRDPSSSRTFSGG